MVTTSHTGPALIPCVLVTFWCGGMAAYTEAKVDPLTGAISEVGFFDTDSERSGLFMGGEVSGLNNIAMPAQRVHRGPTWGRVPLPAEPIVRSRPDEDDVAF